MAIKPLILLATEQLLSQAGPHSVNALLRAMAVVNQPLKNLLLTGLLSHGNVADLTKAVHQGVNVNQPVGYRDNSSLILPDQASCDLEPVYALDYLVLMSGLSLAGYLATFQYLITITDLALLKRYLSLNPPSHQLLANLVLAQWLTDQVITAHDMITVIIPNQLADNLAVILSHNTNNQYYWTIPQQQDIILQLLRSGYVDQAIYCVEVGLAEPAGPAILGAIFDPTVPFYHRLKMWPRLILGPSFALTSLDYYQASVWANDGLSQTMIGALAQVLVEAHDGVIDGRENTD